MKRTNSHEIDSYINLNQEGRGSNQSPTRQDEVLERHPSLRGLVQNRIDALEASGIDAASDAESISAIRFVDTLNGSRYYNISFKFVQIFNLDAQV